ncbi:MAG: hypothetical protein WKG01_42450 [Kofleriaceae bacterium]
MGADDRRVLLGEFANAPGDVELRRKAAEAVDAAGEREQAIALLEPLVNLTGHDDDVGLPCLCKRCLPQAGMTAESAGMQFQRSFAVAGDRVLHFWMLAEMAGERAGGARRSRVRSRSARDREVR